MKFCRQYNSMIRIKFLLSCLVGTAVYVAVSVFAGQNGLNSYKQLENQKREISRQTALIQNINQELTLEKTALQNDKDLIAAYARKLDYVSDSEKLVKINGLKPYENTLYDTGTVLRRTSVEYIPEDICKLLGFTFFFMTLILFFLVDLNNGNIVIQRKKKTQEVIKGIPVYDLPQI